MVICGLFRIELSANSPVLASEDTMQAIMLNVLPRPMPSPSIPPRISLGFGLVDPVMRCLYLASILAQSRMIDYGESLIHISSPEIEVACLHSTLARFSVDSLHVRKLTASF